MQKLLIRNDNIVKGIELVLSMYKNRSVCVKACDISYLKLTRAPWLKMKTESILN